MSDFSGIGRALDLEVDPVTPTTMYVGTWGGGVWKTTNAGMSWENHGTDKGLPNLTIACIEVDDNNTDRMWVAPAILWWATAAIIPKQGMIMWQLEMRHDSRGFLPHRTVSTVIHCRWQNLKSEQRDLLCCHYNSTNQNEKIHPTDICCHYSKYRLFTRHENTSRFYR